MYYVYYGYVGPDNYDASNDPIYRLRICHTQKEVLDLKEEFEKELPKESSNPIFRVIEGIELELTPEETVTVWRLT